jgi:Acetyltransferase (GNAT) domain
MSEPATATALPLPSPEPERLSAPLSRVPAALGELTIGWDEISPAEWSVLLARVPHSNLEQAYPYGRAMRRSRFLRQRLGVIEVAGLPAGIVQLHERTLWRFKIAVLVRGPLWLDRDPPVIWWRRFIDVLARDHPPGLGRLRFITPELAPTPINRRLIETAGFRIARPNELVQRSIRVDLTTGEAERYRALRADWRRGLQNSERANLKVRIEKGPAELSWLLARRGAPGSASVAPQFRAGFLNVLARAHFAEGSGHLFIADSQSGPVAGALVLGHGKSATYVVGWSSPEGRASGALHFLMWRAMQALESRYVELDLGCFSSKAPEDVIAFKRGIGGNAYELSPMFH